MNQHNERDHAFLHDRHIREADKLVNRIDQLETRQGKEEIATGVWTQIFFAWCLLLTVVVLAGRCG